MDGILEKNIGIMKTQKPVNNSKNKKILELILDEPPKYKKSPISLNLSPLISSRR